MADKKNALIVIKRIEEDGEGGHHGGGWKVAYADFMTAMMAFFLLLWILAASDEEKLRGLANYFTPTLSQNGTSSDSAADLRPMSASGVMTGTSGPPGQLQVPEFGRDAPMTTFDSRLRDTPPEVVVEYVDTPEPEDEPATGADPTEAVGDLTAAQAEKARTSELDRLADDIADRIESDESLAEMAKNVRLEKSAGGLTVQVLDQEARSLFPRGSARMSDETRNLILAIGEVIGTRSEPVEIVGHTDSTRFGAANDYTNWELSADRANATRRILMSAGMSPTRFAGISGVADTQPIIKDDPEAAENRRISIRLLYPEGSPSD